MKTNFLRKTALLAVAMLTVGGSNTWAAATGELTAINIGEGTVELPISYDYCQTDYSGKIKDGHFDSMKGGNYALYLLNSTLSDASSFDITIQAGTKKDNVTVTFQVLDNETEEVLSTATTTTITKGSWDDKNEYSVTVANVPSGNSLLKIIFNQPGGDYTANIHKITMTPSAAGTFVVTATVDPANAGTVEGAGTYAEGSDVTLTATPLWGYQFKAWTIDGNTYTENPYTIENLSANVEVVATFEEGDAYFRQDVPGELDIWKTNCAGGNINAGGYWENNRDGYSLTYLLNVAVAGNYTMKAGIGTKNDDVTINATITDASDNVVLNETLDVTNNGSWSNFDTKYSWACKLEAGNYTLVFTSYRDSGYTLNLKDAAFVLDEATGISAVQNDNRVVKVYDLQGRRVVEPTTGLYVVNGKKVVVK